MVRIVSNEKTKQTTAVIISDGLDAVRIVARRLSGLMMSPATSKMYRKAEMNRSYVGRVCVMPGDTYDEEKGKELAIAKAMKNYKRGLDKALVKWQTAALLEVYNVNPATYHEAVDRADKRVQELEKKRLADNK